MSIFELSAAATAISRQPQRIVEGVIQVNLPMGVTEFKRKENDGELQPEPLLMEEHKTRFVLFPIKHDDVSEI